MLRRPRFLILAVVALVVGLVAGSLPQSVPHERKVPAGTPDVRVGVASPAAYQLHAPAPPSSVAVLPSPVEMGLNPDSLPGRWVYLSDLAWESATTGWLAAADFRLLEKDRAFTGEPITLAGKAFSKGLGTYPLSEVVFNLGGDYLVFRATVGIDDALPSSGGSAVFSIYVDDVLAYRSQVMRRGESQEVDVLVAGIKRLRLAVEDGGDGPTGDYACWADAKVFSARSPTPVTGQPLVEAALAKTENEKQANAKLLARLAEEEWQVTARSLGAPFPPPQGEVTYAFDPRRQQLLMANNHLALSLGFAGAEHGYLTLMHLPERRLVLFHSSLSLITPELGVVDIHDGTGPGADFVWGEVDDPALGRGRELRVWLKVHEADAQVLLRLTLFADRPYLTIQAEAKDLAIDGWSYGAYLPLDDEWEYLTDRTHLFRGDIRGDGIERTGLVGPGKPALLSAKARPQGLIMAMLDEVQSPAAFSTRLDSGSGVARIGLKHVGAMGEYRYHPASPRLWLEVLSSNDPRLVFGSYRRLMSALYPPARPPDWLRYQWGSWWVWGPGIDERKLKTQIDYIAQNLADLGPWNVLIDSGWHVQYGRSDAELRKLDRDKFPSGLKSLVDYAHSKDIKVVLFLSGGFVHDGSWPGEWLAWRRIVDEHPDWLIPVAKDDNFQGYVLDYTNPAVRQYIQLVLADFFLVYGVDGIKFDGLADPEGQLMGRRQRDNWKGRPLYLPVMDIYRFISQTAASYKKDMYFESGWVDPVFAHPYAHSFRYGDEWSTFDSPYPFGGLKQHTDYAIFQKMALGQPANMGIAWDDPNDPEVRQWLEVAVALGVQVSLGFDLTTLTSESLGTYRGLLAQYRGFSPGAFFGPGFPPNSFATSRDGSTYLGVMNRDAAPATSILSLADYGLESGRTYTVYDVARNAFSTAQDRLTVETGPTDFRLLILRSQPGVMWSASSWQETTNDGWLTVQLKGPTSVSGSARVLVPKPEAVYLDGSELGNQSYDYDTSTGVLTVTYSHTRPHTLRIRLSP